jgi:nucleotide-binding universal stress UspA family protein
MWTPTRLLVPTDLSAAAEPAADLAVRLAVREHAEVVLLHVFAFRHDWYYLPAPSLDGLRQGVEHAAADQLRQLAERKRRAGVAIRTKLVRRCDVTGAILDEAAAEGAGLIVMGTRGWTAADGQIGSVAAQVTQRAACPVLAVPKAAGVGDAAAPLFRRIVVPTDLSPASDGALRGGHALATRFGAPFVVVHVVGDELFEATTWGDEPVDASVPCLGEEIQWCVEHAVARALGVPACVELRAASAPAQGILGEVEAGDLLVLAPHTGLHVVDRVLAGAPCPVLIVRASAAAGPPPAAGPEVGLELQA